MNIINLTDFISVENHHYEKSHFSELIWIRLIWHKIVFVILMCKGWHQEKNKWFKDIIQIRQFEKEMSWVPYTSSSSSVSLATFNSSSYHSIIASPYCSTWSKVYERPLASSMLKIHYSGLQVLARLIIQLMEVSTCFMKFLSKELPDI